jgi:hypothetical protein
MKYKKWKYSFYMLIGLGTTCLQAQQVVPCTGGNASGSGGKASFTVGQIAYTTQSDNNNTIMQGVQQPYEISELTGVKKASGISLECLVYPNPSIDYLQLKIENYKSSILYFSLYNLNGELLESKKVISNEITIIKMQNLVPSTYLLKITDGNNEIKTFNIIKK